MLGRGWVVAAGISRILHVVKQLRWCRTGKSRLRVQLPRSARGLIAAIHPGTEIGLVLNPSRSTKVSDFLVSSFVGDEKCVALSNNDLETPFSGFATWPFPSAHASLPIYLAALWLEGCFYSSRGYKLKCNSQTVSAPLQVGGVRPQFAAVTGSQSSPRDFIFIFLFSYGCRLSSVFFMQ